ncbi:membrane hypothetical protein [Mesorhizobium prunaredense]|uniref:Uncharacterized protein n=1 Tax=Mesorhizobium prunaredense TaxID=1631249 RepID=A0A1R3VB40_9HYPH|nr:membrane hypothetical protein [Mesorhizobium prunaredense]
MKTRFPSRVVPFFSLIAFADPRVVRSLFSPSWLLMLAFLMFSVVMATDRPSAMRAAFFTLIGILTMATILALPRDAEAFSKVIIFTIVVVIGLSYIGAHRLSKRGAAHHRFAGAGTCRPVARRVHPQEHRRAYHGLLQLRRPLPLPARTAALGRIDLLRGDDLHAAQRFQDDGRTGAVFDPDRRAAKPDRHAAWDADPVRAGHHRRGDRHAGHRLPAAGEASGCTLFSRPIPGARRCGSSPARCWRSGRGPATASRASGARRCC